MDKLSCTPARLALLIFLSFAIAGCSGGSSGTPPPGPTPGPTPVPAPDETPDTFSISAVPNAVPGFDIASNAITITGLGEGVRVKATIAGGRLSLNGGAATTSAVTVGNGDKLRVLLTAPTTATASATATLSVNDVSADYSVTAADPKLAMDTSNGTLLLTWNAMQGAASYRLTQDRSGSSGFNPLGNATADATSFGTNIVPHHYLWGSARFGLEACDSNGQCTLLDEAGSTQAQSVDLMTYVKAPVIGSLNFGISAALDAAGLTAAIGETQGAASTPNRVHVLTRATTASDWSYQATLSPPPAYGAVGSFGYRTALSDDGNTLVVGAFGWSTQRGMVCVYRRTGTTWNAGNCIENPSTDADWFGSSIAINETGDRIVVGAIFEASSNGDPADNNASSAGAAYVFDYDGLAWTQKAYLKPETITATEKFGVSVAVTGNGTAKAGKGYVLVGALSGEAAYYFSEETTGFVQQRKFVSENPEAGDFFGRAVAMSSGGQDILIGAMHDDSDTDGDSSRSGSTDSGAVYVMDPVTGNVRQFLKAPHIIGGNNFGLHLAMGGNGNTAVATVQGDRSNATGINGDATDTSFAEPAGGAYYLEKDAAGTWHVVNYLKASNSGNGDGTGTGEIGNPVAISANGETIILGMPKEDSSSTGLDGEDNDDASGSGAAYVY